MKDDKVIYETLEYSEMEKGIGVLSLNRPQKYNAVNLKMLEELEHFWEMQKNNLDTHVILLKGNGEKGFCGGLDLASLAEASQTISIDQFYRFQVRMSRLMLSMRSHSPAYRMRYSRNCCRSRIQLRSRIGRSGDQHRYSLRCVVH